MYRKSNKQELPCIFVQCNKVTYFLPFRSADTSNGYDYSSGYNGSASNCSTLERKNHRPASRSNSNNLFPNFDASSASANNGNNNNEGTGNNNASSTGNAATSADNGGSGWAADEGTSGTSSRLSTLSAKYGDTPVATSALPAPQVESLELYFSSALAI